MCPGIDEYAIDVAPDAAEQSSSPLDFFKPCRITRYVSKPRAALITISKKKEKKKTHKFSGHIMYIKFSKICVKILTSRYAHFYIVIYIITWLLRVISLVVHRDLLKDTRTDDVKSTSEITQDIHLSKSQDYLSCIMTYWIHLRPIWKIFKSRISILGLNFGLSQYWILDLNNFQ